MVTEAMSETNVPEWRFKSTSLVVQNLGHKITVATNMKSDAEQLRSVGIRFHKNYTENGV